MGRKNRARRKPNGKRYKRIHRIPYLEATGAYCRESNHIGQFIEAWLELGESYEVRSAAAYRVYCRWCAENGFNPENAKNFNRAMATHFELVKKRPKDGCRLRAEEDGIIPED